MTELTWDGKYKDDKKQGPVRIALPFQNIETVNESAQDRRRNLELFSSGRDTEWRNRLIWGDKKYVLPSLLPEFAGKVNLIYIDPPFNTGGDFSFVAAIPEHPESDEDETTPFLKQPSILEQKAYRDTWGVGPEERARGASQVDRYLKWFYDTAVLLRDLLAENGSMYVHLDWHVGHYCKEVLDEVFGPEQCLNEIIWKRTSARSDSHSFNHIHDTIFLYSKSPSFVFNIQYIPYDQSYLDNFYRYVDEGSGRRFRVSDLMAAGTRKGSSGMPWRGTDPNKKGNHWKYMIEKLEELDQGGRIYWPQKKGGVPGYKRYLDEMPGVPLQSVWTDINPIAAQAVENANYATQKPEALLARILQASSNPGDLVLDCFCGSGTTGSAAEKLGRRWIACDLGRFAIHTTRKRLLGIPNVKPFVVQNLGKYERQAWQAAEFGGDVAPGFSPASSGSDAAPKGGTTWREREAAYRKFILDLYHATPITGYEWLHGAKAGRMVHVAAVDAPVTQADVKAIAREAWKAIGGGRDATLKGGATHAATYGVDILGWEFALEVNELAKQVAAESRVDVSFKKIPREVLDKKAVEQGDVKFFELGALSVVAKTKKREVVLKLTDFVIPTDDIPEEARKAVKHWSQLVDYWAVDWDFKNDTFHNQWQAYRTRKDPKIELETKYEYKEPGKYQIVVKVIDILGNDTTKTLEVTV
ncbi:MAG: site-specific DNA-methyltransferase [Candidatus Acidiferrales bacterium]